MQIALGAVIGKKIEIRYDPQDMTWIKVYYEDTFICQATCKRLAGQGPIPLKELKRSNKVRKSNFRAQEREHKQMAAKLIPIRKPSSSASAGIGSKSGRSDRASAKNLTRLKKYPSE